MLVLKQLFFCYLLLAHSFSSASDVNKQEAYVIGFLPQPVLDKTNVTSHVTQPITGNLQTIRIGVTNYGETSDDVGFHAYLPEYAEMTSFSMHSEGVVYTGKKTSQQEAHQVLKQAKVNDHNAVIFVPKSMIDHYDDEIQTAATTIHIKAKKQMTFDLQYKETMQDMVEARVKILNRARVALDLYGTTVEEMVGELYSPNYPEPYPNNADITWWVRAPEGKSVRFHLVDLNIEECCDRLTVYDGISIHGNVLAVLTGTLDDISTTILESTGNSLFLHLTSDCSESSSGFKATTSVVPSSSTVTNAPTTTTESSNGSLTACNGGDFIYASSGYIQSPNYPSTYDADMNCSWTIQLPSNGYVVNLTAINFNLETNHDYLNVYDGYSSASKLLASWTGHQSGTTVSSSSSTIHVQFSSDRFNNWQGFALLFASAHSSLDNCGGTSYVRTEPGNGSVAVTSPGYSSSGYHNDMRCSWQIYSSTKVLLSNIHIHLYYDSDHVNIYDGPSNSYPILRNFTGNYHPSNVNSTGNYLFVEFLTDESGTSSGFYFDASAQVNEAYLTAYSNYNYIYSPNYPNAYDNYAYYTWRLTTSYSYYVVKANVLDYDLETCCDHLRFYDGSSNSYSQLQPQGSNSTYYSSYRYMYIEFITDGSVTGRGFQVRYQQTNQYQPPTTTSYPVYTTNSTVYPGYNNGSLSYNRTEYLTAYNGYSYISSPNYPSYYYNNAYCTWRITAYYSYYYVRAMVIDFDLESCCDHLRFYDGSSSSYPEISWQSTSNSSLYSSGRYLYVTFTSDSSVTGRGFQVRYEQTSQYQPQTTTSYPVNATNGTVYPGYNNGSQSYNRTEYLTAYNGYSYISSPNYPGYYYNNAYCTWRITAYYSYYYVRAMVVDFDLESCCDHLRFYDGSSSSYPEISWQSTSNSSLYSSGRYLYVAFASDSSVTGRGFQVRYEQTNQYQPPTTTSYPVNATNSTVYPGYNNGSLSYNRTEYLTAYNGYSYISSPNYPGYYYNNAYCTWRITAYYSYYYVRAMVVDFDLESCCDHLRFYDGSSSSYPEISWQSTSNSSLYSSGRYLYVAFASDSSVTGRGFQVRYEQTNQYQPPTTTSYPVNATNGTVYPGYNNGSQTCKETEYLTAYNGYSYISSPNYPGYYYNNAYCTWRIAASYSTFYVRALVIEFDLESCCDHLRFYDGSSSSYPEISGQNTSNSYLYSSQRYMYVKFTSDGSVTRRGFQVRYQQVSYVPQQPTESNVVTTAPAWNNQTTNSSSIACSGVQHIEVYGGYGYIISPNYPSYYGNNMHCTWLIHSQYNGYVVQLQVYDLYLASYDRVDLYDGPNDYSPQLASFYNSYYNTTTVSTGSYMFIKFTSDYSYTNRGFQFKYSTTYQPQQTRYEVLENP